MRYARVLHTVRRGLMFVAATIALAAAALFGFEMTRGGVLPRVELAGTDVGNLDEAELRERAEGIARRLLRSTITVVRPASGHKPEERVTAPARRIGYRIDVDATVERVLDRGRQANPALALRDHIFSTFSTLEVEPVQSIDEHALDSWARRAARTLTIPPREGSLAFERTTVVPVEGKPGAGVRPTELRRMVRAALLEGPREIVVTTFPVPPMTDRRDLRRVAARARTALSGPVTLARNGVDLSFSPRDLARLLSTAAVGSTQDATLKLVIDAPALAEFLGSSAEEVESEPQDARLTISSGGVDVIPSVPGFSFDAKVAADQLVRVATKRKSRSSELRGEVVRPEFTTADAKKLNITEQVSTFTTFHECCEPRVANIHRIADIVDGTVVEPGETFSLNGLVGQRTTANGFVGAPAIRDGEFVLEIGGGISQFATTIFNAMFFGGYDLIEHQAHSYYFTRYPRGREATVSWPAPDLKFRNDSRAGILIDTSYTGTSITVSFYGHTDIEVDAIMGQPFNFTDPPTTCTSNPSLGKNETRVVDSGQGGFDVVVVRVLSFPDGTSKKEDIFTRYQTQPRLIERRSC